MIVPVHPIHLCVVQTHRDAVECVRRHLPIWQRSADRVVFTSPEDSPYAPDGFDLLPVGQAQHIGEIAAQRILALLLRLLEEPWDYLHLHEYDSLLFKVPPEILPADGGVSGLLYRQNRPRMFTAPYYLHYPMIFTRAGLARVAAEMGRMGTLPERHSSDRYIGLAAHRAGVPVNDLRAKGLGYSRNTIRANKLPFALRAARRGAVAFHGIKTPEILQAIQNALKP